ncbi:MAG: DNA repair protein RadA [Clostridia bacterium]|nr:DNA repair protein RadA [Clostridia bacterium]
MAKTKTRFVCNECGYESPRWMGKCPSCEKWNTMQETLETNEPEAKKLKRKPGAGASVVLVNDVESTEASRLTTGIGELDRVLGGGAVTGSLLLVGGDPGIGKSTLLTQVSANLSISGEKVLYVSGEESASQIKLRATRMGVGKSGFAILPENDMNAVDQKAREMNPSVMIVDSIQTMYLPEMSSAPGSVSQVRECASVIMRFAKQTQCVVFLVGHVTKEGSLAGPRVLEHMVDAVMYFEGDRQHQYRLLRAVKNRFGSINELGIFEMAQDGMREVPEASEALLSERAHDMSGSAVLCAMEGSRSVLVDVQALVAPTILGNPRRMANGVDQGRLSLLLAVLERRAGITLFNKDVYVNVAGGLQLTQRASDLALCAAIASSARNSVIDGNMAIIGEVGLAGEVRAVSHIERRVAECVRMGFNHIIIPKGNERAISKKYDARLSAVATVSQMLERVL